MTTEKALSFANAADFSTPAEWQNAVRSTLKQLIAYDRTPGFDNVDIHPQDLDEVAGVSCQRFMVTPHPWDPQAIYELLPTTVDWNGVTLITLHGHGSDPFSGIYTYPHELARRGYRVVMPILYGKMERETLGLDYDPRTACALWSMHADALGTTLLGARLFDAALARWFANQNGDVPPSRCGCIGLSMGGELALYLAAIDPSIGACVSAGFLSTFGSLLIERGNCQCYSIRDWPRFFDMPDIVGCIAPRPLMIQKGNDDPHFDANDVANAVSQVQTIYEAVDNSAHQARYVTYPGAHILNVDYAVAFFDEHLKHQ